MGADADGRRDAKIAARRFAAVHQLFFGALKLFEDLFRRQIEALALFGEQQAARVTREKLYFKFVLPRADLAADGGLAEVQLLARVGQTARGRDGVKDAQPVEVHRHRSAGLVIIRPRL
jgi:hypothetical protein